MSNFWKDKTILVTGVCGTVGRELLNQLASFNCRQIRGIDNNESELFFLGNEFRDCANVNVRLCDIRDFDSLERNFRGVDIVIHAAALKHVGLCEDAPRQAVNTNITGVLNIINAAESNQVERVIFTSSDKAVNPTNVMGASKLMGERLFSASHVGQGSNRRTIFSSTRFGNVLGSRGSVIPLFQKQIEKGGPVTLTDPGMSRFIMTLEESVALVLSSVHMACGGEVFVTKMPVINISDLAEVMVEELAPSFGYQASDIRIEVTGAKFGEKLYEELMSEEEKNRTIELESFFVVKPPFVELEPANPSAYGPVISETLEKPYNSRFEDKMSKGQLRSYLRQHKLIKG